MRSSTSSLAAEPRVRSAIQRHWTQRPRVLLALAAVLVVLLAAQEVFYVGPAQTDEISLREDDASSMAAAPSSSDYVIPAAPQPRRRRRRRRHDHSATFPSPPSPPSPDPPLPPPSPLEDSAEAEVEALAADAQSMTTNRTWCTTMAAAHAVVPGESWGTLPLESQQRWKAERCDSVARAAADGASSTGGGGSRISGRRRRRRHAHARMSSDGDGRSISSSISSSSISSSSVGDGGDGGDGAGAAAECGRMRRHHDVRPGVSWGTLSTRGQHRWATLDCDHLDPAQQQARLQEARYLDGYGELLRAALAERPPGRRIARNDHGASGAAPSAVGAGRKTVVSVCVCTTSRHTQASSLGDLALFKVMLPSLRDSLPAQVDAGSALAQGLHSWLSATAASTAAAVMGGDEDGAPTAADGRRLRGAGAGEASAEAFEYWLYVLYDAGDQFYDSDSREAEVSSWLTTELVAPLAQRGVRLRFALLRFQNVLHKPGPAFNFMMAAAWEDGADYLYRVNDDTQFVGTEWVGAAVSTLRGYSPPNVGVVGPTCDEGNTRILTHDLVHRTHLEIFEHYYPPIFSDWWMDDWITQVYGTERTRKAAFRVRHLTAFQGTRYTIDRSHEQRLQAELEAGRQRIERWLLRRTGGAPVAREATVATNA